MSITEQNWQQDYLDLHERCTKVAAERDAFLEARTSLIEENGHLYDEIADLRHALTKCVASLDQLLPYLAKVPADVGLLNDALMAARPLVESGPVPASDEQSPEQMLSREQIENIARKVHGECIRLPGATYQHAAEAAVMYTLERIARPAQTEQQPVATWMGTDWNAQQQLIAHLCKLEPGTDLYAAPIAQTAKRGEA